MGWRRRTALVGVFAAVVMMPKAEYGYSVQTHEQLIDLAWKPSIEPLLRARFPGITAAQLTEAHAYAYGGCAIQDLGYYPFGKEFFSDLTHYVRTGDFIRSLLRNAKTPNELAFAVGALSHYVGDTTGHAIATNPSVAKEFPKLEAKYGPSVTYDESPHAHVRTEFAFDVDEISKHRFAPSAYLSHVGLQVARPLLAKAFYETYGLSLAETLGSNRRQRPTFKGYQFGVRRFLPRIAYAENVLHKSKMPKDVPSADLDAMQRALAQSDFENGWDAYRKHAGIGTYSLAGLIFILPKFGVLSDLAIKIPTQETKGLYVKSLNSSTEKVRTVLADLQAGDVTKLTADLPNRDLDTGMRTRPGTYRLTDVTYALLLDRVTAHTGASIPSGLKDDIQAYYADAKAPIATKRNAGEWDKVQAELGLLLSVQTIPEP
jgi:hypothetical protein